ncbi:MAG: MFS transporter, partial [Clostridiales bacterium]|nr:MFS transporter [Clostridiales bacterium]
GEVRARALFHISITLIVGYLCAWGLSGFITAAASWRTAFMTTGCITAVLGIGSFMAMRDEPQIEAEGVRLETPEKPMPIAALLFGTDLLLLMAGCVMNGYVRDGIMNWAPKLLVETQGFSLNSAVGVALIIPLINYLGIQVGRIVYKRTGGRVRNAIMLLMAAGAVAELLLLIGYRWGAFFCALFLALCSAMAYGVNPLITSFLPMEYHQAGRVGFVAGMVDALIYLGSALSGTLTGALSSGLGWNAVFVSWILCTLLGVAAMIGSIRMRMRKRI